MIRYLSIALYLISLQVDANDVSVIQRGPLEIVLNSVPNAQHVNIELQYTAGSLSSSCEYYHASHIVEHAIFYGSTQSEYQSNVRWLDVNTISFNAHTTLNSTVYSAVTTPEHANETVMSLIRWSMDTPSDGALSKAVVEVENETGAWNGEGRRLNDESKALYASMDKVPPCDMVVGPNLIPKEVLKAVHDQFYRSGRLRIILSGDVYPLDIEPLSQLHASLHSGVERARQLARQTTSKKIVRSGSQNQYTLLVPISNQVGGKHGVSIVAGFYLEQFLYEALGVASQIDYSPKLSIRSSGDNPFLVLQGVINPEIEGGVEQVRQVITRALEVASGSQPVLESALTRLQQFNRVYPARSELLNLKWSLSEGVYKDQIDWGIITIDDVRKVLQGPSILVLPDEVQKKSILNYAWVVAVLAMLVAVFGAKFKQQEF